jgi:hypothetical protein
MYREEFYTHSTCIPSNSCWLVWVMYVYIHIYKDMIYICICTRMYVYVYVYVYVYICIHTHTTHPTTPDVQPAPRACPAPTRGRSAVDGPHSGAGSTAPALCKLREQQRYTHTIYVYTLMCIKPPLHQSKPPSLCYTPIKPHQPPLHTY